MEASNFGGPLAGKQACFAYEAPSAYVLSRFAIAYVIHVVSLRIG